MYLFLFQNTQTTLDGQVSGNTETDMVEVLPNKKLHRQINEEVRRMMGDLFSCLEEELLNFIGHLEKQDSL